MKINMTAEEKFNQEIWYILREIKMELLYRSDNYDPNGISFPITIKLAPIIDNANDVSISSEQKDKILQKLKEWNTIKEIHIPYINEKHEPDPSWIFIDVLQPKFDEIYEKFQILNTERGGKKFDSQVSNDPNNSPMRQEIKRRLEEGEKFKKWGEKIKKESKEEITKDIFLKIKEPTIIKQETFLISRDKSTGDFHYKKKPIKFRNKDTIYYLIFVCLYEKGDVDGFCSYETINEYLVKHGKEKYAEDRQRMDRIKNGVTSLHRFSNLPLKAAYGKELIQVIRGKGIILYDPAL